MKRAYVAFAPLLVAMLACGGRTELQDGSWDIAPSAGQANAGVSGSSSGGASGGTSGGQGAAAGVSGAVGTGGTPGTDPIWRQSEEPFCGSPDSFGPATLDLWSDPGGVFLLVDN